MTHDTSGLGGATVVVLGAAGFLGSHLVDRCLDEGAHVVAIDDLSTGRIGNVSHRANDDRLTFEQTDVSSGLDVEGTVDFVAHLASPASPPDYLDRPLETLRVGSRGTEYGLDLADAKDARFLLASTSEVYGDPEVHPQPEGYFGNVNPVGPRSVYDESKRYAEALTMAYGRSRGTDVGIARIFNTYGPRMRWDDGRAVPAFFAAALSDRPLPIHGDGTQTRSLCFVSDMVEGLVRLLLDETTGPVNLGNPQEVTIIELADAVQKASGRHPGVVFEARPVDDPSRRCPDISVARESLRWEPEIGLDEGLAMTVPWFEEQMGGGA